MVLYFVFAGVVGGGRLTVVKDAVNQADEMGTVRRKGVIVVLRKGGRHIVRQSVEGGLGNLIKQAWMMGVQHPIGRGIQ